MTTIGELLKKTKIFLLDMDGTVYLDDTPTPSPRGKKAGVLHEQFLKNARGVQGKAETNRTLGKRRYGVYLRDGDD